MLVSKDEDRSVDADRRDKGERINRSDESVFVCAAARRVMETICLPRVEWEDSAPERYFFVFHGYRVVQCLCGSEPTTRDDVKAQERDLRWKKRPGNIRRKTFFAADAQ